MARIKFEVDYRHPPAKVWRALTDRALLNRWLMPNDFEPRLGAEFQFKSKPFGGWDGTVRCKVVEWEEPRVLAYTWQSNMIDTLVRYRLSPHDGGTRLAFEHDGFRGFNGFMAKAFMGPGWKSMLHKTLPNVLSEL